MATLDIRSIYRKCRLSSPVEAVYDPSVRGLCKRPYPNHPHGCPNRKKRRDCPPKAPLFVKKYQPTVRVVAVIFDFAGYLRAKRRVHPDWTERALANPRHWQGHLKAVMRGYLAELKEAGDIPDGEVVIDNPEGMGVNLTATCERAGFKLEWPPLQFVHQIALVGKPLVSSRT